MGSETQRIFSSEARDTDFWVCPECETENPNDREFCEVCGAQKGATHEYKYEVRQKDETIYRFNQDERDTDRYESSPATPKKKGWLIGVLVAAFIVIIILCIGYVGARSVPQDIYDEAPQCAEMIADGTRDERDAVDFKYKTVSGALFMQYAARPSRIYNV